MDAFSWVKRRGVKGVDVGKKRIAIIFIVEYGERVINVPEVRQRSIDDVEEFLFLVADEDVC